MKRDRKRVFSGILIASVLVFLSAAAIFLYKRNGRDKSNFFAYAIDLENENWTYAPQGLDYGMTAEEVIKAEKLKDYFWEVEKEILRIEETVKNRFGDIKELEFVKRYFFDSEGGLASVRYEMTLESGYEETIRQKLYDQAKAYMPENSRKTNLEDLLDYESILLAMWSKIVVWEDTVYQEADQSQVLTHANSDVVLNISRPEYDLGSDNDKELEETARENDVVVILTVSRYEERLSQAQIENLREQYPICGIDVNPTVDVIWPTLEQWKWNAATVVYGEAVSNSLTSEASQYEMVVIDDTEGLLTAGEKISTDIRQQYFDYELYPTDGMQLVAMADIATYKEEEPWVFNLGQTYYVTEDGYMISTFDENEYYGGRRGYVVVESALSGLKLEDFMRKLKK